MIDDTLSTVARELFAAHHENAVLVILPALVDTVKAYDLIALYAACFVDIERDRAGNGIPAPLWEAREYWRYQITAVTNNNRHIFAGTLSSLHKKLAAYFKDTDQVTLGPVTYDLWDETSKQNIDTIVCFPLVFELRQDRRTGVITHDWSFTKL